MHNETNRRGSRIVRTIIVFLTILVAVLLISAWTGDNRDHQPQNQAVIKQLKTTEFTEVLYPPCSDDLNLAEATVFETNGLGLNIRQGPGLNYDVVRAMPQGWTAQITGKPSCNPADGLIWWPVSFVYGDQTHTGWSAGGEQNQVYLTQ